MIPFFVGHDRTACIWALAGLHVLAKLTRKCYRSQNRQLFVETGPNEVCSYDFVFDASQWAKAQVLNLG